MKTKVNVEGGELVLRNEHGDTVIIPRERRKEAMKALLKDDHRAIDSLALQLPKASRYAAKGTVLGGQDPGNGLTRPDGTKKGKGFYGNLPNKNGNISSELSISSSDVEEGKEVLIPTLIPGLSRKEIDYLLSNKYNPQSRVGIDNIISRKAIDFARKRKQQGFPYFAHEIEEGAFKYASGGNIKPDPSVEGMMGPETTITAKRPEKSIGNFFRRWGYEHSKEGSDSLLGAIGSGIGAALQLPQAAVTYMLDPKGNVKPGKALTENGFNSTSIMKSIGKYAATHNDLSGTLAKLVGTEEGQNILLDPLIASNEIGKGVSRGAELVNTLGKKAIVVGDELGAKYLPNAYKLNPLAFKPNPEAYYRGIGRSGLDDAMESSVLRTANKTGNYGEDLYMTPDFKIAKGNYSIDQPTYKGDPFGEADDWEKILPKDSRSYIAEIPKTSLTNARGMGTPIVVNEGSIPLDNIKLLKQDWLKGYKEIEVPKSNFKSEIEWGKWNKEIPENKALIQSSNELPPIPNQLFIDDVSTINLSRGSSKGKKQIFKKTETTNENGLVIKTRYRGDEKIPSDITVEGKSGYWQLRPNKSAGENTWYFSANMGNPLESGKAMLKINEKFPFPKPVILEPNNLSLDSYNNLLNMGKRKDWTSTFENYIPLNYSSKNSKILKDLNIENTPNTNIFKTKKEADEVVNRVNKFLSEKGVTHPARIFENKVTNTFGVEIPNFKLQRQYQNGGIIGNNGMFDMTNPNIYKALAPTIIAGALALQLPKASRYAAGGTVLNGEDPLNPYEYQRQYSQSPRFKQMLQEGGYPKMKAEERAKNVETVGINTIDSDYPDAQEIGRRGADFRPNDVKSLKSNYDKANHNITLDMAETRQLDTSLDDILSHELGHASLGTRGISKRDANLLTNKVRKDYKSTDVNPIEMQADFNAMRYHLHSKGLDVFNKKLNVEDVKKVLQRPDGNIYSKDVPMSVRRMLDTYKLEDAVKILNTVADKSNGLDTFSKV